MAERQHVIEPLQAHTHTVIFLHGRDSTAAEFSSEFFESQASDDRTFPEIYPSVKWIFPAATLLRSERFEVEMSQWFDMWSTENPEERKHLPITGLNDSVLFLLQLIRNETNILDDPRRLILGGISQGCATAIHTLFHSQVGQLGGFIGLCSWLPTKANLQDVRKLLKPADITTNNVRTQGNPLQTPVFLSHSLGDPVINVKYGEKLSQTLSKLGMNVGWKTYDNDEHWITEPQGVDDMVAFLDKIIK